jgi:RNA polymerase sigma-70 factor (ECF subfamily)
MLGFGSDERSWVRGAQAGRAADVEALFRRHWPLARRAAFLIVHDAAAADDIAQEAFLAALRHLDRFDRRRPFAPWLHRIVVNQALNTLRQERRRTHPPEVEREGIGAVDDRFDELSAALACLSEERRLVLVLRYWLDLTPPEIGDLLGIATGTVHSRLARGLQDLRRELEVENAHEP